MMLALIFFFVGVQAGIDVVLVWAVVRHSDVLTSIVKAIGAA